jgi:hypothetical protein
MAKDLSLFQIYMNEYLVLKYKAAVIQYVIYKLFFCSLALSHIKKPVLCVDVK